MQRVDERLAHREFVSLLLRSFSSAAEGPEREAVVRKIKNGMEIVERELSSLEMILKERQLL